jgi:NitT/TauT family transport system substrate-binding protein
MRAFVKASQFCQLEQDRAARLLVERGATDNIDYARTTLAEIPFDAWRSYDPEDTVRFFALRLRDAGLVKRTPSEILSRGTDFRLIDEIRRELKV